MQASAGGTFVALLAASRQLPVSTSVASYSWSYNVNEGAATSLHVPQSDSRYRSGPHTLAAHASSSGQCAAPSVLHVARLMPPRQCQCVLLLDQRGGARCCGRPSVWQHARCCRIASVPLRPRRHIQHLHRDLQRLSSVLQRFAVDPAGCTTLAFFFPRIVFQRDRPFISIHCIY